MSYPVGEAAFGFLSGAFYSPEIVFWRTAGFRDD